MVREREEGILELDEVPLKSAGFGVRLAELVWQ